MGDYCSGTNHVLPTYGYARAYSGLSITDFQKRMTVQELTADGTAAPGSGGRNTGEPRGPGCARARRDSPAGRAGAGNPRHEQPRESRRDWVVERARADIRALQPYSHAAWEPSLTRMHANELPWRVRGR